jgi:hypothetical protein
MSFFEHVKDHYQVEQTYKYNTEPTLAQKALESGGSIHPLLVPSELSGGTGLMNPSILVHNNKIIVNVRCTNYLFYHSEKKKICHPWGPLTYLHPEDDIKLRTENFYCELDENYSITRVNKVDTSKLDKEPIWQFVGLEDARLVSWDNKLYMTGVRRDTTTNGQGRMELSEISVTDNSVVEVSRTRIKAPGDDNSYCEKNWMPVIDKNFTYIKWCNPTEVVEVDMQKSKAETIFIDDKLNFTNNPKGLTEPRGGSQVIPFGDLGYLALTHEVDLFKGEKGVKDGVYRHRFILWNKSWKIIGKSKDFSIMGGHTEFSCGMCHYKGKILITFGFQDNAAYLLEVPYSVIKDFLRDGRDE